MKANLVCKGGGVKGIALVGSISYLEDKGYEWNSIAGTSAGAIVASLLAVGYNSKEIKEILYNVDYTIFQGHNRLASIFFVGELCSLLMYKGLHSGDSIENFMSDLFKAKGKTKFKDICIKGSCPLKIIATDVTRRKLIILPDDLVDYGIDPLEFEIAKAVRMSTCIPFYYQPVTLNYNKQTYYIVDGGLLSGFPIWVFDKNNNPLYTTFGLNLTENVMMKDSKKTSFVSYLFDVVYTSLSTSEDIYYKEHDFMKIINIPTLNIDATDFNINKKVIDELYKSGYKSAELFFNNYG